MTALTLTGVDGSVWDLVSPLSPAQLVGGMGGLHLGPSTARWTQTARRSGRSWKDAVRDYRKFTINVRVGDTVPPFRTGDAWRALDGQFWNALATNATATLTFGKRKLAFRLDDDNDHEFPQDPSILGKATYSIACVADRPEWLGETVTKTFTFGPATGVDYYQGLGPPFVISTPTNLQSAMVTSNGDLPAYPLWRIVGPASSASVGVGSRIITIPFPLAAGQQVYIDTERQTITDAAGNTYWPQMGSTVVDFAPVPPGGQVPVAINLQDGTTSSQISLTLTPRFRRAWGGGTE